MNIKAGDYLLLTSGNRQLKVIVEDVTDGLIQYKILEPNEVRWNTGYITYTFYSSLNIKKLPMELCEDDYHTLKLIALHSDDKKWFNSLCEQEEIK